MGGSYERDHILVLVAVSPTLKVFALIQVFYNHNIILLHIDGCEYCICRYLFDCILTWVLIKSSVCLSVCLSVCQQRRLKWNLRQITSASAANLAFARVGGKHCIVAHTGGSNLQLAAETCVTFRKIHRCPWDFNVGPTFSSVLLINIVGQASLDYQSTICQVSNRRDTPSGYYVTVVHRVHRLHPPSMMQTQFAYTLNRCSRRSQIVY